MDKTSSLLVVSRTALIYALAVIAMSLFPIGEADATTIELAGHSFSIPARYLEDPGFLAWLMHTPGLDNGAAEIPLKIGAEEVAVAIHGYSQHDGRLVEDLRLRLAVLSPKDRQQTIDPDRFKDIWAGTGSYRGRIIDVDQKTGYFRAFRKIEYPDSWEAFTISPEKQTIPRNIFSFWIGHCLRLVAPITASGHRVDCTSNVVVGDVAIFFHVSQQNLGRTNDLRRYLAVLVRGWQDSAGH